MEHWVHSRMTSWRDVIQTIHRRRWCYNNEMLPLKKNKTNLRKYWVIGRNAVKIFYVDLLEFFNFRIQWKFLITGTKRLANMTSASFRHNVIVRVNIQLTETIFSVVKFVNFYFWNYNLKKIYRNVGRYNINIQQESYKWNFFFPFYFSRENEFRENKIWTILQQKYRQSKWL